MSLIAKNTGGGMEFEVCPANLYGAKCVDVVDLGMETSNYKGQIKTQHKVRIYWMLDKINSSGFNFLVTEKYTLSLSEKANLRLDLVAWRGKEFTTEELDGFDLEKLIGASCRILIENYTGKDGKQRHAVKSIIRADGPVNINMLRYVRKKDKPATTQAPQTQATPQQEQSLPNDTPDGLPDFNEDEDLPF